MLHQMFTLSGDILLNFTLSWQKTILQLDCMGKKQGIINDYTLLVCCAV